MAKAIQIAAPWPEGPDAATCSLFHGSVRAGFPSPAEGATDRDLNLHEHLVAHPSATFFLRCEGDSMLAHGIRDNDLLIVDRSLKAVPRSIVVAAVDGDLTVKQLRYRQGQPFLVAGNPDYPPIAITEEMECHIWGVVAHVVHSFQTSI